MTKSSALIKNGRNKPVRVGVWRVLGGFLNRLAGGEAEAAVQDVVSCSGKMTLR